MDSGESDGAQGGGVLLRWLTVADHHAEQKPLFQEVRPPVGEDRVGICCSGGGLRSAAFCLGGLEVLWGEGVLPKADYLAGVSGGSYAATAATIVRLQSTEETFAAGKPGPYALGSPELDYLRNRTNYLAPGLAGRWNLALRLTLGITLNVFAIFAIFFLTGRVAGWLYGILYPALGTSEDPLTFGPLVWSVVLVPLLTGAFLQVVDLLFRPAGRRRWRILVRWSGVLVAAGLLLGVVLIGLPWLLDVIRTQTVALAPPSTGEPGAPVSVWGALAVVAGALMKILSQLPWADVTARAKKVLAWPRALLNALSNVLLWLIGPLALLATLLIGADATTDGWSTPEAAWSIGLAAAVVLLFWQGNPIAWSMQPFYKRRLRTVFALRRKAGEDGHRDSAGPTDHDKEPHLSDLYPKGGTEWPELLICAAVNVSDRGLTPPGMGISSFVLSPKTIEGPLVGRADTKQYEDRIANLRWFQKLDRRFARSSDAGQSSVGAVRDISPLSAVSVSGAAISPSMGRMTRPAWRMVLALLNLRLGVWLPNPRIVAENNWDKEWRVQPRYLFKEMLGRNSVQDRFLYVTDGGHYENLGLVELLRRGCTEIWCLDAAGDAPGQLRTLGQAQALARAELGVEFDPVALEDAATITDKPPYLCSTSSLELKFRYRNGRKGRVVYVRKALTADAPTDLLTYQQARTQFPYDGTGDQFFDVEQFEAYRRLGVFAAQQAVARTTSAGGD